MPTHFVSIIKVVLAVICFVFSAKLSYDLQMGEVNIPLTAQSLVILCWAVFMIPLESFVAVSIYIALGIFGLPVFANDTSGMEVLMGNTGGYLIGFLIGAVVVSWIRDPYRRETFFSILFLMIIGTAIILICGMLRLSTLIGVLESFEAGFFALWKGAIIKIILGTVICFVINMVIKAMNPDKKLLA